MDKAQDPLRQQSAVSPAKNPTSDKQKGILKWLPLFVLSLALTTVMLDGNVFSVALRNIALDIHADLQSIQWVITISSLVVATLTITGGRLGDLFGRKKMFILGTMIFAIGAFLTSVSKRVGILIAGNAVVEGVGACLMIPATMSLIRSNYQGRDRQVAFGIWGAIMAGAAAVGLVLGGWFATHYSWRWAFRTEVLVAVVVFLASVFIKEYRDTEEKPTIDFVGVVLSALGMLSVVFGSIQASTYGWWRQQAPLVIFDHAMNFRGISATPIFIALGLIILSAFLWWEARMERIGKTPLVSPKLFKNKTFVAGTGVSTILLLGQACLILFVPVFLQAVLKLDPIHTGLAMLPMTAATLVAAPLSAWLSKAISPKHIIQMAIVLDIAGFLVLRQSLGATAGLWTLAPGFIFLGVGTGLLTAQTGNLILSAISVQQAGEASGVANTIGYLGQALGAAVMGAILLSSLSLNVLAGIKSSHTIPDAAKPAITQAATSQNSDLELGGTIKLNGDFPAAVTGELASITNQAAVKGNKAAIAYGIGFTLLALAVSTQLPKGSEVKAKSLAYHAHKETAKRRKARTAACILTAVVVLIVAAGLFADFGVSRTQRSAGKRSRPAAISSLIKKLGGLFT